MILLYVVELGLNFRMLFNSSKNKFMFLNYRMSKFDHVFQM